MLREKLGLNHKEIIMNALADLRLPFSEYSFMNLYLFRDIHDYHISADNDKVIIDGMTRDNMHYAMPLFNITTINKTDFDSILRNNGMIFPVHRSIIDSLSSDNYDWTYSLNDSDYLFTKDKLINYPGRNLHKKRNLLKQFISGYEWSAAVIDDSRIIDALSILDAWQTATNLPETSTDYLSCKEALTNTREFKLTGEIIYIDGTAAGFVLGEMISHNVFALHFAKCITHYKGIYQFIYNHFAKSLPSECEWINFEQDLGIPALRQAKETYEPDLMEHKYRLRLRQ